MTKRVLQISVTVALLVDLCWYVDVSRLLHQLQQLDWMFALPTLILLLLQNDFTTRRWTTMLRAFDEAPGHFRMLRIQYMALFAQLFLPPSVGGAAVRSAMLVRSTVPLGIAIYSVVLDRIVAVGGLLLLAGAFMPAITVSFGGGSRWLLMAGALPIVLAVAALIYRPLFFWLYLLKRTPLRHVVEPLERAAPKIIEPGRIFALWCFPLPASLQPSQRYSCSPRVAA